MVPKIASVVALIASGAAAYFGYNANVKVEELQSKGKIAYGNWQSTKSELETTKKKLKDTVEELETTKATLETTRTDLATAKETLDKKSKELTEAQDKLAASEKVIADLTEKLKVLGDLNPEQLKAKIEEMVAKLKDQESKIGTLEKEKAELTTTVETLTSRNKDLDTQVASQTVKVKRYEQGIVVKGLTGTVRAVNAGWGFCVLSIGDRQGAAANKVMIVGRNGQAIGKVRISNVETNQSVADILTNTFAKGTYIQPGDTVIFTGEDKVKTEDATDATPTPIGGLALPR